MIKKGILPLITILTAVLLVGCSVETTNKGPGLEDKMETSTVVESVEKLKTEGPMTDLLDQSSMTESPQTSQEGELVDNEETMSSDHDEMEDTGSNMMEQVESDMMSPNWLSESLVNAHTGEPFTIEDFKGNVILVETLAMWCSNCLKQQQEVSKLHQSLDVDNFISIGIDIDPNENTDALKSYIEKNGFSWYYAIAPDHVAREIGQLYGSQFLNPPSTPMLIIDSHGEVHTLPFGIKSSEELLGFLQMFLGENM